MTKKEKKEVSTKNISTKVLKNKTTQDKVVTNKKDKSSETNQKTEINQNVKKQPKTTAKSKIVTPKDESNTAKKKTPTKSKKEPVGVEKDEKSSLPPIQNQSNNDYDLNRIDLDFEHEVYDEADIASALEMGFIAQALEAHKAKVAKETHPDFDGESCLDCGEEIPQLRLDMGRIRCVHCQEALERKNKMHGR